MSSIYIFTLPRGEVFEILLDAGGPALPVLDGSAFRPLEGRGYKGFLTGLEFREDWIDLSSKDWSSPPGGSAGDMDHIPSDKTST